MTIGSPRLLGISCAATVLVFSLGSAFAEIDFVKEVRPIFESHCYRCHGPEKQKSSFRLDIKAAALQGGSAHAPDIIPGQPEASPLVRFVSGEEPDWQMPAEGDPLSDSEIATLRQWIKEGAHWPDGIDAAALEDKSDHWSFKPIGSPDPPASVTDDWGLNSIDAFILSRLRQANLGPSPEADRATWIRRVTFDLTGLPPTPDQIDDFLADDSAEAYEKVVDRLLASPRYGERWAQHWLDVVRYADTHGFEVNTERPHAWPYRDYVIDAFNRDLPYDQFIREQLAGDATNRDAATGFLVTAAVLLPGQIGKDDVSKRLARQDELSEIVINTGEAFLGLSIGCARCHDHKFDPISARDFYSMQAFFAGVEYGDRVIRNPSSEAKAREEANSLRKQVEELDKQLASFAPLVEEGSRQAAPINAAWNIERFVPVKTTRVRLVIESTNKLEPCIDELEVFTIDGSNIALSVRGAKASASGSRTSPGRHELPFVNDGRFGNSRSWMSNEDGKGWVQIEFPEAHQIDRVAWGRDRLGKFKDRLPLDYRIEVSDASGQWQTVASSANRPPHDPDSKDPVPIALAALDEADRKKADALLKKRKPLFTDLVNHPEGQLVYAGKFKPPESIHLLNRGDPEQPKEAIAPASIVGLGSAVKLEATATDQERRQALADWITRPAHPLTARVMVNRLWQWHFGIGLVDTANDFGRAGVAPSHPLLLDWLATRFIESGWSIKEMHRLIVLSATYRQSNQIDPKAQTIDADARLLWHFPSRRLESEAIRDSMLAVSGRLNPKAGGKGFDLFRSRGGLSGFPPIESFTDEGRRRMIYAHRIRMEREIVFGAFDCPDAGQSLPRRRQSTTPIQALNLFNSRFTMDESDAFARRIQREAGSQIGEQVDTAWRLAFNRLPATDERHDAISVVGEHGLATLCRAIFNSSEFLFLP